MNTKKRKLRGSDVDVLYRVDPRRLSIKLCHTSTSAANVPRYYGTTTYECFAYDEITLEPEIPSQIETLPAFVAGMFYFATEEEAQDYVKKQIGL